jgi:hypothetical protein
MPALAFGKIASVIGIKGFVAIGLALALAIMWWRADTISGQRDAAIQARANEQAAHTVTKASLSQCIARSEAYVAEGLRRQKAAAEALRAQEKRSAALDAQIARLRATKPTQAEIEACESPAAVLDSEGL